MPVSITQLPYSDTGYFSALVTDYLAQHERLQSFYSFAPDINGIEQAITQRDSYKVNRDVLTNTLQHQYRNLEKHEAVERNLELLKEHNTYTICTAHQPNLLTGYLYFIYKIIHAIKLAEELSTKFPDKHFVPVYYMGSEDNDLDELGTFRYEGKKFVWDGDGQKGAVGRMQTRGLKKILDELFKLLGPPGENCDHLKLILQEAYLEHKTIGAATQYLVNALFGKYGLVVLDPDEASFKREILSIMQDDLLQHSAEPIVTAQAAQLAAHYKAQAYPRLINLFYLNDGIRERIEKTGDRWQVVDTTISWTKEELQAELNEHPERFSPNVILRGLLQESILPDVAFIGGGAEVAYWLQLKPLFEHYNVFYPVVLLRQSVLWIGSEEAQLRAKMGLETNQLFYPKEELAKDYLSKNSAADWQTIEEKKEIAVTFDRLKQKATTLDSSLKDATEAALAKMNKQLDILEKKMLRAEKRKMEVQLKRIDKLKDKLFPNNSLQERVENFTEYILRYRNGWLDVLKDATQPLIGTFVVIEHRP